MPVGLQRFARSIALLTVAVRLSAAEADARHWAFQPPRPAPSSQTSQSGSTAADVDRRLDVARSAAGLAASPEASATTLLRRVRFDLTGLPPTPQEVVRIERIAAANGGRIPDREWEELVDRLLASPAYGERWGRHWLDVARFAESSGKERNQTFPEAWRYRDWVVAAFNADKPYDRFLREQVAGDLYARDAAPKERADLQVATGFLAIGPKGLNERRREQFVADLVDEQVDTVTRAILGVTVACARCHDHKFDPISQRDYYAMAGIFRSTETCYGTVADEQRNRQPSALIPIDGAPMPEWIPVRLGPPTPLRPQPGRPLANARHEVAANAFLSEDHRHTNALAMGVREGRPEDAFFLVRGEISQRQGRVPRGLIPLLGPSETPRIPSGESGRRQLAEWLTDTANPLTARVAVNRVWQHLFGRGLVPTGDDFGRNGQPPTHPELLDQLALGFMEDAWSVKRLVRRLVLTRAYRMSSDPVPAAMEKDPDNTLLWRARPRRLESEALRDALLAASGTLEARPPRGSVVAQVGDVAVGGRLRPGRLEAALDFRSVYLPVVRDAGGDFQELFDGAEPSLVVCSRDETHVPSQALFLMNSPFVMDHSRALARRLSDDPALASEEERIVEAHRRVLGRSPSAEETRRAVDYLRREATSPAPSRRVAGRETAWSLYVQALFNTAEFRFLR